MDPQPHACPVCGAAMATAFQGRLLDRHDVTYFLCGTCGLLQTESPHWLEEAYSTAIARTDLGLVQRNVDTFRRIAPVLYQLHGPDAVVLDAAGGYGMLARLLRDRGFDAWTTDAHCENLLCGPFEAEPDLATHALCAIEVMEHLEHPRAWLADLVERHGPSTLIFSTVTWDGPSPPAKDWWYYAPETGQHITFFQPRTIERLASELGFHYLPLRRDLHLFTREPLGRADRRQVGGGWWGRRTRRRMERGMRGRSRLPADYEKACALVQARDGDDA